MKTHGTRSNYNQGCRCNDCKAAAAKYQRDREQKKREEAAAAGIAPEPRTIKRIRKLEADVLQLQADLEALRDLVGRLFLKES